MSQRRFGRVVVDPSSLPGVAESYAFFACPVTGVNGELFGTRCDAALLALDRLSDRHSEALLRAAGTHLGGDATTVLTALLAQQTTVDELGRLRFPGRMIESGDAFEDAAGQMHSVVGRGPWKNSNAGGNRRLVWLGGDSEIPYYVGIEQEGVAQMVVMRARDLSLKEPDAAWHALADKKPTAKLRRSP